MYTDHGDSYVLLHTCFVRTTRLALRGKPQVPWRAWVGAVEWEKR